MANRLKEDEKNERIIRGLLKLQENRRCINCGSLGPQYVCTNFWTFVCTNCSGIHREFTHRVKSISMAKFTSQEASALQEGGNQRAKEIYFKEWDPHRHSLPDSSNIDKLRDFIKHVYVDRRFSGERTHDKPPRGKMGDKDDFYENRRVETYQGGSKSPPYEDAYERRYSDRSSPGGRSPGYDQESRQYGDYRRSPGRPPIINDWRREDRFGDGRRLEDRRISDGDYKLEGQSPERTKDLDSSSSPVVRPVRDILGENVVPLRISEPPKTNSGKAADGSALTQRTASSGSIASSNGNAAEVKLESTKSLIDFDAEPEPPVAPAIPQAQQTTAVQSAVQPAHSSDDNWASFDTAPVAKTTQGPSNFSPLDSVLSQLSMPSPAPAQASGVQGPLPASAATAAAGAGTLGNFSSVPPSGTYVTAPGLTMVPPINDAVQWASAQRNQPVFPTTGSHPTTQQFIPSTGGFLNGQWNVSPVPTMQGHPSIRMPHASPLTSKRANEVSSSAASQPSIEVQQGGRKELPEDLFTAKYSSFASLAPGWQMRPPHGMGIYMQYNTAAPMPSFPQSSKSTNPFDVSSEPPPVQAPTFPSMSSLQGVLPSIPPSSGVIHPLSLGNPSLSWNSPRPSYGSVLPPQAQVHAPAMAPRAYLGQQVPTNMPVPGHQEIGNSGARGAAFGFSNPDQQMTGMFSTPAAANSFPAGGNPFG
ncbi:probable ADP-ribosylation factor GTPase-activating protein AGD14 isoform X2 [Prosopis cineraria]|uniref:probable ADP-ribosylation factor GTPase-activating protein AGD14 isoform X2 n=1 Tax=Prosopis cineraria TaxID=364024 RepID=UPI00240EF886|nr:probable ADP-ribosylation factor GTPase-activating protein AGD14 isoform X2 [Prosopis cineraria]